jgi:hypothetical protein
MSKKYYLYKFEDNWADEADFSGFAIFTEEEKRKHEIGIKRAFKNGGSICFGTNEDNEYDSYEDVESTFEFEEITKQEYFTIKRLFGETFGHLGPLDESGNYEDSDEDDEDDEDDEEDTCSVCGDYDDTGSGTCTDCMEEEENGELVEEAKKEIEKAFGVESDSKGNYSWKPTPLTSLSIEFEGDNGYVNLILKKGNRTIDHSYFHLEDNNIIKEIKRLIKAAQAL